MPPKQKASGTGFGANLLNLERIPGLSPKFANKIGKTCGAFGITFDMDGVHITADSWLSATGQLVGAEFSEEVSLLEFERRVALHNTPSNDERLLSLKRKYELRLNRQFPAAGPASGSEADIQAWLGTVPFAHRRALLMSQKDFAKSFPEGFRDPQ